MDEINITSKFSVFSSIDDLQSSERELLLKAIEVRDKAYAPYSNFNVGAIILMENGEIVSGTNQENAAYPSGMCAERVAIWSAASKFPNVPIEKILISADTKTKTVHDPVPPCGACRQAIIEYEIKQKGAIEIFFTGGSGKIIKANSMAELLPLAFDKALLK